MGTFKNSLDIFMEYTHECFIGFYTQKKTATIKTWPSLSLSTEENYFFFVKIAKCLLNFSTRPPVSTIFCLPVKKG